MNQPMRKVQYHGLTVDYRDDVSGDQVKKLDDLVRKEFESGEWVPLEEEA